MFPSRQTKACSCVLCWRQVMQYHHLFLSLDEVSFIHSKKKRVWPRVSPLLPWPCCSLFRLLSICLVLGQTLPSPFMMLLASPLPVPFSLCHILTTWLPSFFSCYIPGCHTQRHWQALKSPPDIYLHCHHSGLGSTHSPLGAFSPAGPCSDDMAASFPEWD